MSNTAIYAKSTLGIVSSSLAPTTASIILGIMTLTGPSITRAEIDVTNHASTAIERIGAPFYDAGSLDFSFQFSPKNAIHDYLLNEANSTSSLNQWAIKFSDGTVYDFSGSLLDFGIKAGNPQTDVLMVDAKVRLTGNINFSSSIVNFL